MICSLNNNFTLYTIFLGSDLEKECDEIVENFSTDHETYDEHSDVPPDVHFDESTQLTSISKCHSLLNNRVVMNV